ncbi:MAG: shikimate kinase, partial [Roseiarcus sp.]
MGVSGSGKTVAGTAIAEALGIAFFDGDDLHSPEARAKMTAGIALNDDDRAPWLA